MIIRSFFRRTTTRIYIALLTIIIAAVCVLNSLNAFLGNQANKIYINSTRLIVSTEQDLYDVLRENENIINIRRGFLLESPEDSIQFVDEDPNFDKPLSWSSFSYLSLTSITTYLGDNDLVENEIELGFSSLDYYNSTIFLDDYLGKTITADYQGEELKLVIKKVYDAGPFPEIKISKSIYDKLEKKDNRYFYSSQIKHEKFEESIKNDLLKYKKEIIKYCPNYEYQPFNKNGTGNQGYLFDICKEIAKLFISEIVMSNTMLGAVSFIKDILS